jgi:hypothetical protein
MMSERMTRDIELCMASEVVRGDAVVVIVRYPPTPILWYDPVIVASSVTTCSEIKVEV